MAERSSPVVRALVNTSWTFPSHDGSHAHHRRGSDVVRGEPKLLASSAAILATGPLLAPSTAQTPTPVGAWSTVTPSSSCVEPATNSESGAPGAGLTTTVMPSASAVANGGTTRSLCSSVMPSLSRSSRTFCRVRADRLGVSADDQRDVRPGSHEPHAAHERDARGERRRLDRPMDPQPADPGGSYGQPSSTRSRKASGGSGVAGPKPSRARVVTLANPQPSLQS